MMMRRSRRLLFGASLAAMLAAAQPADADPISGLIVTALSFVGVTTTTAAVTTFLVASALSTGLSYLSAALRGGAQNQAFGIQTTLQSGGTVPRRFPIGTAMDPGSEAYPARTWGKDGKTPNAYFTRFIALSDLPTTLTGFICNDKVCTYGHGAPDANLGYAIPEYNSGGKDHLWVKFYDGTQIAADAWAVSQFGDDPDYPYGADQVGHGVAYAIVTALIDQTLFSNFPDYKFILGGIKLYDPTHDSSVGGSGAQRWDTPATWAVSKNPAVAKYNVLRGITWNGQWLYGLQNGHPGCCPLDNWFAAINADAATVEYQDGVPVPQFQCGGMVSVDTAPADLLTELNKCDNGRLTEAGGLFLTRSGPIGAPVMSFTDKDLLISEAKQFNPFPDQDQVYNAVTATWPDPSQNWTMVDAPALYDAGLEASDGGKRRILDIAYNFVPFGDQVQGLMKFARDEKRKFRNHTAIAAPRAVVLNPFDPIAWTSAENGYVTKVFEVIPTDQDNLDQGLNVTEVDPADYDWNPATNYRTYTPVPIVGQVIPSQPVTGAYFEGIIIEGDGGRAKPGGRAHWNPTDVDDVDGVLIEVRRAGAINPSWQGESPHSNELFQQGYIDFDAALLANTDYEGRFRYRPISNRPTDWTDWLAFTTPDVGVERADLGPIAKSLQDFFGQSFTDVLDRIHAVSQAVAETGLGASTDMQGIRRSLQSVAGRLSASFTEQIAAATGPGSAIVQDIVSLGVALDGKASTSVTNELDSRLTTAEGDIEVVSGEYLTIAGQINDGTTGLSATFTLANSAAGQATINAGNITVLSGEVATISGQINDGGTGLSATYTIATGAAGQASTNAGAISSLAGLYADLSATIGGSFSPSATVSAALSALANDQGSTADLLADLNASFGTTFATAKMRFNAAANPSGMSATVGFSVATSDGGAATNAAFYLATDGTDSYVWAVGHRFIVTDGFSAASLDSALEFVSGTLFVKNAAIQNLDASKITTGTLQVDTLIVTGSLSKSYTATQSGSVTANAATATEILRENVVSLGGTIGVWAKFAQTGKADSGSYNNCQWELRAVATGTSSGITIASDTYYANDAGELWRPVFGTVPPGSFPYGQDFDVVLYITGDGSKRPIISKSQLMVITNR